MPAGEYATIADVPYVKPVFPDTPNYNIVVAANRLTVQTDYDKAVALYEEVRLLENHLKNLLLAAHSATSEN